MINKDDKIKMFVNEINDISDKNIREFAKCVIENADDYFFVVPASSSGKYHPSFSLGDGGLVRHTRCVVFFAECAAESMMFDSHDRDLLILSALSHDIRKQGNGSGRHTVAEHPLYASEYLARLASENSGLINGEDLTKVCAAVERHMGKWGAKDGLPIPETEFEKALQIADYIASRKEILEFNFRPSDSVEVVADIPEVEPGDYIIDFGKYKGKGMTIREIHEGEMNAIKAGASMKNSTYIEWMAGLEDFQMKDAQEAAKKFLASYKKEPPKVAMATVGDVDDLPF